MKEGFRVISTKQNPKNKKYKQKRTKKVTAGGSTSLGNIENAAKCQKA